MKKPPLPLSLLTALTLLAAPAAAQTLGWPPDMSAVQAAVGEMPRPAPPRIVPVALPAPLAAGAIWDNPPIPGIDSPETKEYAAEAARLAARGLDFSGIFQGLCRHMLEGSPRTDKAPRAEVANLFRGLIRWSRHGGTSAFQGRTDWPLHFVYGGYLTAVYNDTVAEAAAYAKEERDAFAPNNSFDLDDFAVTMTGARWMSLSGNSDKELRRWAQPWASGQKTLDSLPAFHFGRLPPRRLPAPALLRRVMKFVRAALPA